MTEVFAWVSETIAEDTRVFRAGYHRTAVQCAAATEDIHALTGAATYLPWYSCSDFTPSGFFFNDWRARRVAWAAARVVITGTRW